MTYLYVNSAGLVFDIIGACLIFYFGLPEELSRSGVRRLALEDEDRSEVATARRYDVCARAGLLLLILGFAVQLVANGMQLKL